MRKTPLGMIPSGSADWGGVVTLYMTSPKRREDKLEECKAQRVRIVEAEGDTEHWQLADYRSTLKGSAMKRAKLDMLQRNARIALSNADSNLDGGESHEIAQ